MGENTHQNCTRQNKNKEDPGRQQPCWGFLFCTKLTQPTGNLDHQNGLEVMSLLNQAIREFSLTLLVVTHDPTIAAMADRVITLSDGVILSDVKVKHALSSDVKGQGESDE